MMNSPHTSPSQSWSYSLPPLLSIFLTFTFNTTMMIAYDTSIHVRSCEVSVSIELCLNFNPIRIDCTDEMKIDTILMGKRKKRKIVWPLAKKHSTNTKRIVPSRSKTAPWYESELNVHPCIPIQVIKKITGFNIWDSLFLCVIFCSLSNTHSPCSTKNERRIFFHFLRW